MCLHACRHVTAKHARSFAVTEAAPLTESASPGGLEHVASQRGSCVRVRRD